MRKADRHETNLVRQAAESAINPEAVAIRKENQDAIEEARRAVALAKERIGKLANLRKTGAGTFEPSTIAA